MEINAIIFGATGHIGQGVLIECLENPAVRTVLSIGRRPSGATHDKLKEVEHHDFLDYSSIRGILSGYNACFFCLGVSSVGMSEEKYHLITHDYAVRAAETLCELNNEMVFCFISGAGADDTLKSRLMWARVKGKTENSLKALPFKAAYIFRPAYIQPVKGVKPSMAMYRIVRHFYPVLKLLFPKMATTTEEVGRAMIRVVRHGYEKKVLENPDIIKAGRL